MEWLGFPTIEEYKGLVLNYLSLNKAYVIGNTSLGDVGVFSVDDNCYKCPYKLEAKLTSEDTPWQVHTGVQYTWRILKNEYNDYLARSNQGGLLCVMRPTFGEYGVYRLDVGRCEVEAEVQPVKMLPPILIFSLLTFILVLMYGLIKFIYNKKRERKRDEEINLNFNPKSAYSDLESLHFMRGILIIMIIFITSGGGGYAFFQKNSSGISFAEGLFFIFIWTVGVGLPTIIARAVSRGQPKYSIFGEICLRAVILLLLGIVIDSTISDNSNFKDFQLWCPLQRLGISYFIVASSYLLTEQNQKKAKKIISKAIGNVLSLLWCWIISGLIMALIIILISTLGFFNCESGEHLLPPVWQSSSISSEVTESCSNEHVDYVNKLLIADFSGLVDVHTYYSFYKGTMGFLSTTLIAMIGLKIGTVYIQNESHSDRLKLWNLWATLFGVGGLIFGVMSTPIKFNLWPISTIVLLSTLSLYTYSIIYVVVETWGFNTTLIKAPGEASLALLAGHQLFGYSSPFFCRIWIHSHFIYLLQNLWTVFLWVVISFVLLKKKVRIPI